MSTRTVYRGSHGRFAGASGGKAEKVKAGGFANAAFQQRFQSTRASRAAARASTPAAPKAPAARSVPRKTSGRGGSVFSAKNRRRLSSAVTIGVTAGATAGSFGLAKHATGSRVLGAAVAASVGLSAGSTTARAARVVVGKSPGRSTTRARNSGGKKIKR